MNLSCFTNYHLHSNKLRYSPRPHPVGVILAVNRALRAADIVLVGRGLLDRHDPHHQLLLHHFHLLLLGFLGLHLVHKFWPSFLQLVAWTSKMNVKSKATWQLVISSIMHHLSLLCSTSCWTSFCCRLSIAHGENNNEFHLDIDLDLINSGWKSALSARRCNNHAASL